MRILLICLVLFIVPPVIVLGLKSYQSAAIDQPSLPVSTRKPRGEVLFFNATWCGPCRQMKPVVTKMKHEGYRMRDIDVDKNRSLAQKYNIRGIPTFVFIENGSEVRRFSGGTSPDKLKKLCASPIYH